LSKLVVLDNALLFAPVVELGYVLRKLGDAVVLISMLRTAILCVLFEDVSLPQEVG
jgi:hypothetical protein